MENQVGRDTVGKVEEVNASYELLPRKEFTYDTGAASTVANGKALPREQYDAVLALYQAQNAIQIAEGQDAQRYAPDRIARARALYEQARGYPSSLAQEIVSTAREASQAAEDSRVIAVKRAEEERAAAEQLRSENARKQAEAERAAADQAEAADRATEIAQRTVPPPPPPPTSAPIVTPPPAPAAPSAPTATIEVSPSQFHQNDPRAADNRRRIVAALTGVFEVTDTPRGIVVTLPESAAVNPGLPSRLKPLALAMQEYPNLHIEVQGHSAGPEFELTQRQADTVRDALVAAGAPGSIVVARGYGNSRPRTSNAAAGGRAENRRVEIVIAGDAIGSVPTWDRTYSLRPPSGQR